MTDLANLTLSFFLDKSVFSDDSGGGYNPWRGKSASEVPVTYEEIEKEYCRTMSLPSPIQEMTFAGSWMVFRVSVHTLFYPVLSNNPMCPFCILRISLP